MGVFEPVIVVLSCLTGDKKVDDCGWQIYPVV